MRCRSLPLFAAIVVGVAAPSDAAEIVAPADEFGRAVSAAVEAVAPSVVRLMPIGGVDAAAVEDERNAADSLRAERTVGPTTGLVVSADGLIVTSSFVFLGEPAGLIAELPDGRTLPATRVAEDKSRLIVLLRVDPGGEPLRPSRPAKREPAVGTTAIAVGRAFGREATNVAVGIVSATGRIRGRAVQTDAKVSPLNYGGPLIDFDGGVIGLLTPLGVNGINVSIDLERYDSGIGFAVPLGEILPRLAEGEDLSPGLLGVSFRGEALLTGPPVVGTVRPGSPADTIGLEPGDVVTAIDGRPIDRQAEVLIGLGPKYAGEAVAISFRREGEELSGKAELAAELVPYARGYLGVVGRPADDGEGTVVTAIDPDGPAARAGLVVGDRIIGCGEEGRFLRAPDDLRGVLAATAPGDSTEIQVDRPSGEVDGYLLTLAEVSAEPFDVPPRPAAGEIVRDTGEIEDFETDYWSVAPPRDEPAGLVVFLHPTGRPDRAAAATAFARLAEERGVAAVGPLASGGRWRPESPRAVAAVVDEFLADRNIDRSRVAVVGAGTGGSVAAAVAFGDRTLYRGLALIDAAPRRGPPPNDPDFPLLTLIATAGEEDPPFGAALRRERYPVAIRRIKSSRDDAAEGVEAAVDYDDLLVWLGPWVDGLGRL